MALTDQPIRCAIVGYGLAGKTFHAPLIAATPGLELYAVASSRPDAVRSDWPNVETVADFESLLADPRVDLIVIATPDELHATQAKEALKAGKHVIVDKPFAATLAEAQAIAAEAAHSTKVCTVFQNRRWDAALLTIPA